MANAETQRCNTRRKVSVHAKSYNEGKVPKSSNGTTKRSSFIHQAKQPFRQLTDLPEVDNPLRSVPEQTPWSERYGIAIYIQTHVKGILSEDEQNSVQRRSHPQFPGRGISTRYMGQSIHRWVSTECSEEWRCRCIYIEYPHKPRDTIRTPTGKFCNNYDA